MAVTIMLSRKSSGKQWTTEGLPMRGPRCLQPVGPVGGWIDQARTETWVSKTNLTDRLKSKTDRLGLPMAGCEGRRWMEFQ